MQSATTIITLIACFFSVFAYANDVSCLNQAGTARNMISTLQVMLISENADDTDLILNALFATAKSMNHACADASIRFDSTDRVEDVESCEESLVYIAEMIEEVDSFKGYVSLIQNLADFYPTFKSTCMNDEVSLQTSEQPLVYETSFLGVFTTESESDDDY